MTSGKTICLLGSPRRDGNSDRLAKRFCREAEARGADVECAALSGLDFKGCINLFRCKRDLDHCGQQDDFSPFLKNIAQSDVLVMASPIYFTDVSWQLKAAIDRMFSFFVPDYPVRPEAERSRHGTGKTLVFCQTQGEPEHRYPDLLDRYGVGFGGLGFTERHLLRAWGVREPDDIEKTPAFFDRCAEVADAVYGTASE